MQHIRRQTSECSQECRSGAEEEQVQLQKDDIFLERLRQSRLELQTLRRQLQENKEELSNSQLQKAALQQQINRLSLYKENYCKQELEINLLRNQMLALRSGYQQCCDRMNTLLQKNLQEQNKALQQQLFQVNKNNKQLLITNQFLKRTNLQLKNSLQKQKDEQAFRQQSAKTIVNQLKNQYESLKSDNEELKSSIGILDNQNKLKDTLLHQLKIKIQTLEDALADASQQMAKKSDSASHLKCLIDKLNLDKHQLISEISHLSEKSSITHRQLQRQIAQLQLNQERLESDLRLATKGKSGLGQEKASLKQNVKVLEQEVSMLKNEQEKLIARLKTMQKENQQIKGQRDMLLKQRQSERFRQSQNAFQRNRFNLQRDSEVGRLESVIRQLRPQCRVHRK